MILGFLLAATGAAPQINNILTDIIRWLGGGRMNDAPFDAHVGDARAVLAGMPGASANCIVTSPPYWGKRDYGVPGQYGHEDTPAAYVATMREVFREARRVLADDGTCWLNLGDSYSASGGGATGMHAYLGEHLTTHRWPECTRRTCSACRGGWRSRCKTTAGSCGTRSCGTSRTPCPSRCATGCPAGTSRCSCSPSQPGYWFDLDPIREPHKTVTRHDR